MTRCIARAFVFSLVGSLLFGANAPAQDPPETPDAPPPEVQPPPSQPPTPPDEQPPAQPTEDLPAAKLIIDKCIEAMGGAKVFEDMTSTMAKCRIVNAQTGEAKLELYWMKPNKVFIKQSLPGMESTMGSDGVVAWMKTSIGPQILDGEAARQLLEEATMFRMVIHLRDDMQELKTLGRTMFSGSECFKITATNAAGDTILAYFDEKDALIRGVEYTEPGAPAPTIYRFSEWKEADGIRYFTKVEIEQRGQVLPLLFDEVEFNKVDEAIFTLPDEILALLKEKETEQANSQPPTQPASAPQEPGK